MSLAQNYLGMSLQEWEQAAHTACFQLNHQLKSNTQTFFFMFLQNPNFDLLLNLFNNGSSTLLFVIFTYLTKHSPLFCQDINNLIVLTRNIGGWQLKEFTFVRKGLPALEQYVTRTIMLALGMLFKRIFQDYDQQKAILDLLQSLPQSNFKLYLLRSFIQAVEILDYEVGYMNHRTLVYSFQDNIIPYICEVLIPNFYKVEQSIQVYELSSLHQSLRVDERRQQYPHESNHQLSKQQQTHANYIFLLLKKLIEFNFNITYPEYQNEQMPETHRISFPQPVTDKIINSEFLKALFFVISKILHTKVGLNRQEYILIGLECVSKIMQSRLSILQEHIKQGVVFSSVVGLATLLNQCKQTGNPQILEAILLCNKKLLNEIDLPYIKQLFYKQEKNCQIYDVYFGDLIQMIVKAAMNSAIEYNNSLLREGLQLSVRILMNQGYKQEENIEKQSLMVIEFAKSLVTSFVSNFISSANIFSSQLQSYPEHKAKLTQLLQHFKKIAAYDYSYFFTLLHNQFNYLTSNAILSSHQLANILFLLSQTLDKSFLQKSPFINKAKYNESVILGSIIKTATLLAKSYIETGSIIHNKQSYLQLAIVMFTDSILTEFLQHFEFIKILKITHQLYFSMVYPEGSLQEFKKQQDNKSQELLLGYINILVTFVWEYLRVGDEQKMLQAFSIIQKVIFRLKWYSKREAYIKSQIFKLLQRTITDLFCRTQLTVAMRQRVAKILVTLTFDDILDQYKFRINKFLNILKSQSILFILYNLTGVFEGIQTFAISRHFYNSLKKAIDLKSFFLKMFQQAYSQHELLRDLCRLVKCMVNNKGMKVSNNNLIYELFATVLPNLTQLLSKIRSNTIEIDVVAEVLCELLQMMNLALSGTHLNMCLVHQIQEMQILNYEYHHSYVKLFFAEIFTIIANLIPTHLKMYPKLQELVLIFYNSVNNQLLRFVLQDYNKIIVLSYSQLHLKLKDLTIDYIKDILNGVTHLEQRLCKVMDALKHFFQYCSKTMRFKHRVDNINNIRVVNKYSNQNGQDNNQVLVFYLLCLILTNCKDNIYLLRSVARALFWLNQIFDELIMKALVRVNASEAIMHEFKCILQNKDETGFVVDMKSWCKLIQGRKKVK